MREWGVGRLPFGKMFKKGGKKQKKRKGKKRKERDPKIGPFKRENAVGLSLRNTWFRDIIVNYLIHRPGNHHSLFFSNIIIFVVVVFLSLKVHMCMYRSL